MSQDNVVTVKYTEETAVLTVYYRGGSVHEYSPVSKDQYLEATAAEKVGSAIHNLIRNNNLVGKRIQ